MRKAKHSNGHFASLFVRSQGVMVPTSVTTQRKRYAAPREAAKRAALLTEITELTGTPAASIARSIDGVRRRWNGVSKNSPDG